MTLLFKAKRPFSAISSILLSITLLIIFSSLPAYPAAKADKTKLPPPSSTAQRLYQSAQKDLLQLRVLTKNGRAQATVGSGFLIGTSNLVVTNYHVVSQLALKPETYVGEYLDTNGKSGLIELLAVDVLNDLAVVSTNLIGSGFFKVPEQPALLNKGQYLYSLGNPLDLGFTISEGSFNGIMRRSFYDEFMFTGPINSGMSGGPCITSNGQLAGVNVSKRTDGELVSFIVPTKYVHILLKRAASIKEPVKDFKSIVGQQLLAHQTFMVDKVLGEPLTFKTLGKYKVPIRESDQMRCWGSSSDKPKDLYTLEQINCAMESAIFVSDKLRTGVISIKHQFKHSSKLGAFRFSRLAAASVKGETFGDHKSKNLTGPECSEEFLSNGDLPMRAVLCVRTYKKFAGLYDFAVLADTTDEPLMNLESRLDVKGVSYENGLRISRIFLEGIRKEKKP